MTDLVKAIASVNSIWSIAAFSIAALLVFVNQYSRTSNGSGERTKKRSGSSRPGGNVLWVGAGAICLLGLAPIAANGFLETLRMRTSSVYHVRVTVLNEQGVPVTGAQLRASVSNEITTTANGEGLITVARGTLPATGEVTIFAEKTSAYLAATQTIKLTDDLYPSLLIQMKADRSAIVNGLVEDDQGHAVPGASVTLPGVADTTTSPTGNFSLKAHASVGQPVTIHVEKPGYAAVDQSHLAGTEPATIVLPRERR
jgi:carboxypeptidase family protein